MRGRFRPENPDAPGPARRFQIAERVAGVFMDAIRRDQPLAVFLQALGGRLLIAGLDEVFAIVGGDGHVARQHQQRRARAMRHRDVHDHVGEAGAFGARTGRDFAGAARKSVRRRRHGAFRAPAKRRNARRRNRVDDLVIARTAEQRGQIFVLAGLGENLRARHPALLAEIADMRGFGQRVGDFLGNADGGNRRSGGGKNLARIHQRGRRSARTRSKQTGLGARDGIRIGRPSRHWFYGFAF